VSLTARITEFQWNSHFCDEQIQGPFALFHHRHDARAEVRDGVLGTRLTDVIDYALPFGFIGALAGGLVRRKLAKMFAYRQRVLPESLTIVARLAVHLA
jgi:ligand-binding SRPBCC domain-containing protein